MKRGPTSPDLSEKAPQLARWPLDVLNDVIYETGIASETLYFFFIIPIEPPLLSLSVLFA